MNITATVGDLATYVGENGDTQFVARCLAQGDALVEQYVGANFSRVPQAAYDRAVLEVGAELFHRRQAPGGITQFATMDGAAPVRMARDPMVAAYPILDPFLPAGLA